MHPQPLGRQRDAEVRRPGDDDAPARGWRRSCRRRLRRRAVDIGTSRRSGARFGPAGDPCRIGAAASVQHGDARGAVRQPARRRSRRRRHQHVQPRRQHRHHHRSLPHVVRRRHTHDLARRRSHDHLPDPARARGCARTSSASSTSTPTPTSTTRCSASASRTAAGCVARSKTGSSIRCERRRSVSAAPVTPPTTSTGCADWARSSCTAEECWHRSLAPLMDRGARTARQRAGLPHVRRRRPRPVGCARHRHTRDRRIDRRAKAWRSSAAAEASTSSAATSSRSPRPTTRAATPPCWAPTSPSNCCA